jgi:peptide/nickel transport system substrate-binding protein
VSPESGWRSRSLVRPWATAAGDDRRLQAPIVHFGLWLHPQWRYVPEGSPSPVIGSPDRAAGEAVIRKDEHVKRWATVLAVTALIVAACGSSGATAPAGPNSGGTLTVALDSDIKYADPSLTSDQASLYVAGQVVEGLVGLAPGSMSQIVPVLAASLPTVSADGKTYTFKLRPGIKFHDGTDFNAKAVRFNYERWRNYPDGDLQKAASYYSMVFGAFGASSNLVEIDTPDDTTVVFHLQQAQSNFLISQTVAAFGIQSPTAITANDGNNPKISANAYALGSKGLGKAMVGTGPFMFKEWKAGDHVTLVRNPSYWNPITTAHLDQIIFKPFSDSAEKLKALQSGSVDLVETLEAGSVGAVSKDSNLMVLDRGTGNNLTQLAMNDFDTVNGQPNLLSNKGVRFAIAAAIEKSSYISGFYSGEAVAADSWMPAGSQYYKREYLPTYNLSASRGFLAGAGVPTSGLNLDFYYPTGAPVTLFPDPKGMAQAMAVDLKAAGFVINLKSEAYAAYLSDAAAGKLQMWLQAESCRWAGPDDFLYAPFHYVGGLPASMFNYKNDALDSIMAAAGQATDAGAATAWYKAQDLLAADMPTVPLMDVKLPAAARRYVMGFVGSGVHSEVFGSVWLNK